MGDEARVVATGKVRAGLLFSNDPYFFEHDTVGQPVQSPTGRTIPLPVGYV